MQKKQLYEAPGFQFLVINFEQAFLQGSNPGFPGSDDDYDDQGDF